MSAQHPIIAVTGSSGAGTSSARQAFERIFTEQGIRAAIVEGDGFHRYSRAEMDEFARRAAAEEDIPTHFGAAGNHFDLLEELFREYARHGTGRRRSYAHGQKEAAALGVPVGTMTEWADLPDNSDLLFYEGLHAGVVSGRVDIAAHVDLLIGLAPIINLEWMQKIHRDQDIRGYSSEAAVDMILHRMRDYAHYILPQFSRTHINFQRVPTVDTSNPFACADIPGDAESFVVIHVRDAQKIPADLRRLQEEIPGAFLSAPDTVVAPAGRMESAMRRLLSPVIRALRDQARDQA